MNQAVTGVLDLKWNCSKAHVPFLMLRSGPTRGKMKTTKDRVVARWHCPMDEELQEARGQVWSLIWEHEAQEISRTAYGL
jgi:hypothetical protein